jgi:hypothetical protein
VYGQTGGENTAELLLFLFLNAVEMVDPTLKIHMTVRNDPEILKYYKEHFLASICSVMDCEMHHIGNNVGYEVHWTYQQMEKMRMKGKGNRPRVLSKLIFKEDNPQYNLSSICIILNDVEENLDLIPNK